MVRNTNETGSVTVIGDSVTLGASSALAEVLPGAYVDATVSRSMKNGVDIVKELAKSGMLGEYIVIALASNANFDSGERAEEIVKIVGKGKRIIFVTGYGKDFMTPVNEHLRKMAETMDGITVADWEKAILGNTEHLAPDGIHAGDKESKMIYANTIAEAIKIAKEKKVT
jgi:hypothetical protein